MFGSVHPADRQPLAPAKIASYRHQAERILSRESNLFAEMVLRVISTVEIQASELEALRRAELDRLMESELIARENQLLRARVVELEAERSRLADQLLKRQQEINELKKARLKLPPSWE